MATTIDTTEQYPYIVCDRPGYFGTVGVVYSRHRSYRAAKRRAAMACYTDEHGQRRQPLMVARNTPWGLRKGNRIYSDMMPDEVPA